MANVKITDLTELAAADVAGTDVFPIVDLSADATKKVTIASLQTAVAAANDFVTYTNITANLDIVQDNVASEATAIEARRVANIAGAVSTITTGNLDTNRALISDGSGKVAVSPVTSTEIGYVDGVTSAIQTQIDTKIATTDSASNDFITYTQLNANINLVSANVALGLKQLINVAASATGEGTGSNNFFVATPPGSNPIAIDNVIVSLNGITQTKTTDYIYTPASGKVTFTDAAIPSGLTVQIISLNPPT